MAEEASQAQRLSSRKIGTVEVATLAELDYEIESAGSSVVVVAFYSRVSPSTLLPNLFCSSGLALASVQTALLELGRVLHKYTNCFVNELIRYHDVLPDISVDVCLAVMWRLQGDASALSRALQRGNSRPHQDESEKQALAVSTRIGFGSSLSVTTLAD